MGTDESEQGAYRQVGQQCRLFVLSRSGVAQAHRVLGANHVRGSTSSEELTVQVKLLRVVLLVVLLVLHTGLC